MAALAFYVWTLSPSVGWADASRLQMDVSLGGSTYWFFEDADRTTTDGWPFQYLGVAAWDHPLYVMLAQIFVALPGANVAWRINLLSALAAALAVAGVFSLGLRLTGDKRSAMLAAAALAVSHTFWFHAVTAEVYSLHALFMVALIGFGLDPERYTSSRARWAVAFVAGLGTANHLLLMLTVVTVIVCSARFPVWQSATAGERAGLVGAFLLGFAPWWIQFVRMSRAIGLASTVQMVSGLPVLADRLSVGSLVTALTNVGAYAGWLIYQFTPFGVAVGVFGFVHLRHRTDAFRMVLALFVIHVVFSANYQVADRFAFHHFSYVVFAVAMAGGFSRLLAALDTRLQHRRGLRVGAMSAVVLAVLLPVALYAITPRALSAAGIGEVALGIPPVGTGARDGIAYFLNPNRRGDDSADRFGLSTMEALGANALVFAAKESDQETYLVLRYFQLVQRQRPDVELDFLLSEPTASVPAAILRRARAVSGCRPIYLASLNPRSYPLERIQEWFRVVPESGLYRLRPIDNSPPPDGCEDARSVRRPIPVNELVQEALRKP